MKDINTVHGMTARPAHLEQARALDHVKPVRRACAYAMLAMLIGYTVQLIDSAGDIGTQEKHLIFVACAVTLLVVIPITALTTYFVSRRRVSSTSAEYSSSLSHPIRKEAAAWAVPILVIAVLAFLGWGMTHSLDLYKPVESKGAPSMSQSSQVPGAVRLSAGGTASGSIKSR